MLRVFKLTAIVMAAFIGVFVVVGALRTNHFHVVRTFAVNAPPARVFALVSDLQSWRKWQGYDEVDPGCTWTYGGTMGQAGSSMTWSGEHLGHGALTVSDADPARGLWWHERVDSATDNVVGQALIHGDATTSTIEWTEDGELPRVVGGWVHGFIEDRRGENLEESFQKLAAILKAQQH